MNYLAKIVGALHLRRIRKLERKIGYRIDFSVIPDTWINGLVRRNIGPSWKKHGINALGINHWTIGSINNGVSSRYNRDAKQYQSWLGAYLVKFKEDRIFTVQDHFNLAIADQKNWLKVFGDPNPYINMDAANISSTRKIKIGNYTGDLYDFSGGKSHSDIGSHSNNPISRKVMLFSSILFNRSNYSLDISQKDLLPSAINSNYEDILLKGYIVAIPLDSKTYVILYGNGTAIVDKKQQEIKDYTPDLKSDILHAFDSVRITLVN